VAKAKQVGRVVVTKATRVVQETVNHVKDVYDATAKWVKEHKDRILLPTRTVSKPLDVRWWWPVCVPVTVTVDVRYRARMRVLRCDV
jgi:hypothetical protein